MDCIQKRRLRLDMYRTRKIDCLTLFPFTFCMMRNREKCMFAVLTLELLWVFSCWFPFSCCLREYVGVKSTACSFLWVIWMVMSNAIHP
jgi:hypothetical protein